MMRRSMICSPGIVVYGMELTREWRRLHNEELLDLHSRYCDVRKGANRGVEKTS